MIEQDRIKVLVVDDEEDLREGCKRSLRTLPCEVELAGDGRAGLHAWRERQHDVIFLDLKMPGMDGMEVLEAMEAEESPPLIIVITGFATVDSAISAMKMGAYDFIAKPFEPEQIRLVARRAFGHVMVVKKAEALKKARERTLADLGMEKSRVAAVLESLPSAVVVTNAYGMVALKNSAFARLFDLDSAAGKGAHISEYIKDEEFTLWINSIATGVFMGDGKIPSCELRGMKGGFYLGRGQHVLSEAGECLGAVVTLTDITALKTFDQMKSEFVSKVSHELRSPLTTICQQLSLVEEEAGETLDEGMRGLVGRAKNKAGALIALIGDLLDLQRIEGGEEFDEAREVDLSEFLSSMVDFLSTRAQAQNLVLNLSAEAAIPPLKADPAALESIFGNLITNAIKYTGSGGHVDVRASCHSACVKVEVEDDGFGMGADDLAKIFDKFYRIKDDKRRFIVGTGLGLSIVRKLVEGMDGAISVTSQPGVGSTFTVTLPLDSTTPRESV